MRVISIRQPWAMLVALGAKRRETRSWYTAYRGPIAIHASAAMPVRSKAACSLPLVKDVLSRAGYESWRDMPRGAIIAVGRLTDVQDISPENTPPSPELDFGDYTPGRFQWVLSDVRLLPEPIPAKGALGLWRTDLLDDLEIE
ncbi:MAG TPA: ASCH domain-containing protein [Firmicutes bacterium]|nr:ASCH domain-containing protein [Candidatus Fermentithermobacillaceae bacterium]